MRPLIKLASLPCALYLAACTPTESPLSTASETGETEASASDTSATEASVTEASVTEASVTEASATEASATDTSATDTSATGETDTGDLPAGCEEAGPAAKIEVSFAFADWDEIKATNHTIETTCVVGESAAEAGFVTTALSCELDGVAQPATLRYSASALDQDYAAGDQVTLKSASSKGGEVDNGGVMHLTMRSLADDRLLLAAMREEVLLAEQFLPLVVEDVLACGSGGNDIALPMQIQVSVPEGPSVAVFHGGSGVLELGDGFAYTVDVAEATVGNCCHFDRWHHLLLRRVHAE